MPLGCDDDGTTSSASTVTLTNLSAGEYTVVVDTWNQAGGHFELAVKLE